MLKSLRKKGVAKKILWVIAVVIIFSFGFFGTANMIQGNAKGKLKNGMAGKLFGKNIPIEDYNKIYKTVYIQAVRQYGYDLGKVAHLLNLEGQTWDRMILLREAALRRIRVPDAAVIQTIQSDPSFQRDGRFNSYNYNMILRNLNIRPREYEESMRDNLQISELYKQVTGGTQITREEAFAEYQKRNEKVQVSYIFVSPDPFKESAVIDPAVMEQYYKDHSSEFLLPPMINVRYLTFAFPEPLAKDEPAATDHTPEEAASASEEPTGKEDQQAALEDEKDKVREQADAIFHELLVNPDMEKIAVQNDLTIETTGFFSMEQPNLTLGWSYNQLEKIFQMNVDDIADPIETPNGVAIAQIIEKKDSYVPDFTEAKDKVLNALREQEAKKIARAKADEYLQKISGELAQTKAPDFAKAAKSLGLEIQQTPVFTRGQYLPKIGISSEFESAAFALNDANKLSGVIETPTGDCILYLDGFYPASEEEFEKEKAELEKTLLEERRNAVFGEFFAKLREEAQLIDFVPELQQLNAQ